MTKPKEEKISYTKAMEELEAIVASLEADDADIDQLASQVAHAGDLIKACREQLGTTKSKVDEIIAGIEGDESSTSLN